MLAKERNIRTFDFLVLPIPNAPARSIPSSRPRGFRVSHACDFAGARHVIVSPLLSRILGFSLRFTACSRSRTTLLNKSLLRLPPLFPPIT